MEFEELNPCKISTGILAGSRRDRDPSEILASGIFLPGGNLARKRNSRRPKSRRDPAANLAKILAGKQKSRHPKSRRDPAANLTKILAGKQNSRRPKSRQDPAANLSKILAGKQKSRRPKSRCDSCCEPHQDYRREAIIPGATISPECYRESRQDSRRGANSRWQNLGAILPGISARLATGSEILGEIH